MKIEEIDWIGLEGYFRGEQRREDIERREAKQRAGVYGFFTRPVLDDSKKKKKKMRETPE